MTWILENWEAVLVGFFAVIGALGTLATVIVGIANPAEGHWLWKVIAALNWISARNPRNVTVTADAGKTD